ncbi:hypothetical protein V6Z12_D04G042500 [Gossypium hirsutum]
MQLQAILKYHLILGLVDSGSTYNFTSVIVAKCLGLPIQAQSGLSSNGQWRKGHQFKNFPRGESVKGTFYRLLHHSTCMRTKENSFEFLPLPSFN